MKHGILWSAALLGVLAGCAGGEEGAETEELAVEETTAVPAVPAEPAAGAAGGAQATLQDTQGQTVGTVQITPAATGQGVTLAVNATNLPQGEHGIHIHTVGQCSPDFSAAGGHLNPTQRNHGFESPNGPHMGDLRNLTVGADGTAQQELTGDLATMEALFDADGSAIVVHAQPDDYRTDPSGNSGDRIACGVVQRT